MTSSDPACAWTVHKGADGIIQWALVKSERGTRRISLGDSLLVKVLGQEHPGVALLHEMREVGNKLELRVYWLYRQQDLHLDAAGMRLKWEVTQDMLCCPARLEMPSGGHVPRDEATHEVCLSLHDDTLYPQQILHPVMVHWVGSQDIGHLLQQPHGSSPAKAHQHHVIRPGFVCRKMLQMESKVWRIKDLKPMLPLLENAALSDQVKGLIKMSQEAV